MSEIWNSGNPFADVPHLAPERKVCSVCAIEKPLTEFTVVNKKEGYRRKQCKSCYSAIERRRRAAESPTQRELRYNRSRQAYHRRVTKRSRE